MKFKGTVFDLDGTLLNTLEDLGNCMNSALGQLGFAPHPVEEYRFFVGDGIKALVERTLPEEQRDEDTVQRGVAAMEEEYGRRWDESTRPYDDVPQLLDALTDRQLRMAILSNKPEVFTKLTVERLLPQWHFDPVCGARPDVPCKPDPAGALAIAAAWGVEPAQCLYLGDTDTDMATAVGAGMYAVGAAWGFRPGEELKASGAQVLVEEPLELLELL